MTALGSVHFYLYAVALGADYVYSLRERECAGTAYGGRGHGAALNISDTHGCS